MKWQERRLEYAPDIRIKKIEVFKLTFTSKKSNYLHFYWTFKLKENVKIQFWNFHHFLGGVYCNRGNGTCQQAWET